MTYTPPDTPIGLTLRAIGVLTAQMSDMLGESDDLGKGEWSANVVSDRGDLGDAYDDWRQAMELALGLMNLSTFLAMELARKQDVPPTEILQRLARKLALSQSKGETGRD